MAELAELAELADKLAGVSGFGLGSEEFGVEWAWFGVGAACPGSKGMN